MAEAFAASLLLLLSSAAFGAAPQSPRRVVTLMPSLAELVAELLADHPERLVGVVERSDWPERVKGVTSVGPYPQVSLERVLALKPDLVLASMDGNSRDQIQHLREMGLNVRVISTGTLREIEGSIREVGEALGASAAAGKLASAFHDGVEAVKRVAGAKPKYRVMLQFAEDPLVVAGKGSFLDEAMRAVGAENVYGDSRTHYPKPSLEDVLKRDPEVIVLVDFDGDAAALEKMRKRWNAFPRLKAVATHRIREFQGAEIFRPTERLVEGLRKLDEAVHGDR